MDIIINSLYQDKDVFLRELISNAADACDKKRFKSLTSSRHESPDLKIQVKGDAVNNTLTIEDSGIGMTKDELVNNLGKIAQSGSRSFMKALKENKNNQMIKDNPNLIGQFGVGFYSGYLVADQITVISKAYVDEGNGESKQWKWQSNAVNNEGSFTIYDDSLSKDYVPIQSDSGTRIILKLKEECDEYSGEFKLKDMLRRYSSFITFPIDLWSEKTEYKPEEALGDTEGTALQSVAVKTMHWERINSQLPIWMRPPKEVNRSEYNEFYKSTFKAYDEPNALSHFALEGQVDFKALLFIPTVMPYELTKDMFSEGSKAMKLFVKRVFINDKFDELMPRWLTFVRGIVDSEDLPLNVGREILQKSKMLGVINKRLVRKSMDMMFDIEKQGEEKYKKFYNIFGRYIKVGMIEDDENKDELAKLVRVWTSKSQNELISLSTYVKRMKTNQTKIYYVTGDGKEIAARSPALEKLKQHDIEVIYLVEPLDELAFQAISTFNNKMLADAAKGDGDLDDFEDPQARAQKKKEKLEAHADLQQLCDWLKDKLGRGEISKVDVSNRLTTSPAAIVQGAYGMSPTMQRYMKAQVV